MKQQQPVGRKISDCIALAKAYEEKPGYAPAPDPDFAKDVQEGIGAHREPIRNVWDEWRMGLVLDSSVLVLAERQDLPVSELLDRLQKQQQAAKRSRYLDTVSAAIPLEPFTREIGHVVGRVDAEASPIC